MTKGKYPHWLDRDMRLGFSLDPSDDQSQSPTVEELEENLLSLHQRPSSRETPAVRRAAELQAA